MQEVARTLKTSFQGYKTEYITNIESHKSRVSLALLAFSDQAFHHIVHS